MFAYSWVEEQVDVLVQKCLVLLVPSAKVLQELMSQSHDLLHADILALKPTGRERQKNMLTAD